MAYSYFLVILPRELPVQLTVPPIIPNELSEQKGEFSSNHKGFHFRTKYSRSILGSFICALKITSFPNPENLVLTRCISVRNISLGTVIFWIKTKYLAFRDKNVKANF